MASYNFTKEHPPLLKNYRDILNIDPGLCRKNIGEDNYTKEETKVTADPFVKTVEHVNHNVHVRRYMIWLIVDGPIHYAEDLESTIVKKSGYTEIQKVSFENVSRTTVGGGIKIKFFNFSSSVENSLKITEDTSKTWVSEDVNTIKQVFKANNTYVTWRLYDVIEAVRDSVTRVTFNGNPVGVARPEHVESSFQCAINQYQDKVLDSDKKLMMSAYEAENARLTAITKI